MTPSTSLRRATGLALVAAGALLTGRATAAAPLTVPMALATPQGLGASVGSITLSDTEHGVAIALNLKGLPPGQHGFHLHEKPSCDPSTTPDGKVMPAGGAGAHLDPAHSGKHLGPMGEGHLGDLPRIDVGANGAAHATLAAGRFKSVEEFRGHALMIHAGGDNYSDVPPLGGGGARLACGVVR
jgi:Cu-Zn family superoxide dismutase